MSDEMKPTGTCLHILLAEDDSVNQKLIATILQKNGHRVTTACNGNEVIALLKGNHFDLILMDIEMPEMDGLETAHVIRDPQSPVFHPHIPIIAMTAYAQAEDRERCISAGMNGHVSKPVDTKEFLEVIGQCRPGGSMPMGHAPDEPVSDRRIINKEKALVRLDGDEDILQEIWEAFLYDAPIQMKELEKSLEERDFTRAARLSHSLKSAAASIGAESIEDEASRLEFFAGRNDLNESVARFKSLVHEIEKVMAVLSHGAAH